MKKLIHYYDRTKAGADTANLAIYIGQNINYYVDTWGADNVAIYTDSATADELAALGIVSPCIKTGFKPPDNQCHSMRLLSVLSMQTEPFQTASFDERAEMCDSLNLEVESLQMLTYNNVLDKYAIQQTGGVCIGNIMSVPDVSIIYDTYIRVCDIIEKNNITNEQDIDSIIGALLYYASEKKGFSITKHKADMGINYNWILFGVNKKMLLSVINPSFKELTGDTLTIYMLNMGYSPISNMQTRLDEAQVYYEIRMVDEMFMQFAEKYMEAFTFQSKCLAWVINPTYEEMQSEIPDYFPRAKGRKFADALICDADGNPKQYQGDDVYPCFFYDTLNEDGTYTSTAKENDQDDFWAFYKFFGADRIILDYKIREYEN